MDLKNYVPRADAEARILAAEAQVETLEEAVEILQSEIAVAQAETTEALGRIAAAEAKAAKEEKECEAAKAEASKERDLRGQAELSEANVRADLKISQAETDAERKRSAECERDLKASNVTIESQRKVIQEATVKAATEERLRIAAEKKGGKSAPSTVTRSPASYEVEISQRTAEGGLHRLTITPRKDN